MGMRGGKVVVMAGLCVMVGACAVETTPPGDDTLTVDPGVPAGVGVSVHASGNTVFMSYIGGTDADGCTVVRSDDGGATWGQPVVVDAMGDGQTTVHAEGQNVYVAYSGRFPAWDIRFVSSADGGATWASPVIVEAGSSSDPEAVMAVSNGSVYLAYSYWPGSGVDLHFARSDDAGANWTSGPAVSGSSNDGVDPSIVVSGQAVYVGYTNESALQGMVARSTDNGVNWETVSVGPAGKGAGRIAMEGGELFTTYEGDSLAQVVLARSTDGGDTWDAQQFTPPGHIPGTRRIAVVGDSIYLAYEAASDGAGDGGMRFARSDDRGQSWPESSAAVVATITGNGSTTQHAAIAVTGSGAAANVHVGFHDGAAGNLKATVSRDNGATWGR